MLCIIWGFFCIQCWLLCYYLNPFNLSENKDVQFARNNSSYTISGVVKCTSCYTYQTLFCFVFYKYYEIFFVFYLLLNPLESSSGIDLRVVCIYACLQPQFACFVRKFSNELNIRELHFSFFMLTWYWVDLTSRIHFTKTKLERTDNKKLTHTITLSFVVFGCQILWESWSFDAKITELLHLIVFV